MRCGRVGTKCPCWGSVLGGAGAPVEMAIQHIPPAGYVAAPSLVGDAEPELRAAAQFSRARAGPSSRQACGGAAGGLECPGGQARRKFSRVSRVYTRASSLQCGPHLDRRHH